MGIMSVDRESLSIYHNEGVHQTVKKVYERFVNGTVEPQNFTARIVLIGSPNWRTTTLSWMKAVDPQSPGIQGWLLNKEQTAMLMATLRARTDFAEVAGAKLEAINGQAQYIENLRTVSYARTFQQVQQPNGLPMYIPMNDTIREGYQIKLTPMLSPDEKSIDMVVQCSLDQVEKLNAVLSHYQQQRSRSKSSALGSSDDVMAIRRTFSVASGSNVGSILWSSRPSRG